MDKKPGNPEKKRPKAVYKSVDNVGATRGNPVQTAREQLKGKKAYLFAALAVGLGAWGWYAGELSAREALEYVISGGALAAVRAAIGAS